MRAARSSACATASRLTRVADARALPLSQDYEKTLGDQLYYCYELVTDKETTLVSVTAYGGRFYGAFVVAPKSLVTEDQDKYYRMVDSFCASN